MNTESLEDIGGSAPSIGVSAALRRFKPVALAAAVVLTMSASATTALATPANDGVFQIDNGVVQSAGGYPYHITQPGSYRLAADLTAKNTSVILVSAPNVTLDLHGFTVTCQFCSGVPGIVSTGVGTTIMNGNVTGFNAGPGGSQPYGLFFQATEAKVDHVTATYNGTGIFINDGLDLMVTNSSASNNSQIGINAGPTGTLTVIESKANNNFDGIVIGNGLVTGSAVSGNGAGGAGLRGGILVSGAATITNNIIINNAVFGIALGFGAPYPSPTTGYGSNTFWGNVQDLGAVSSFVSMKNNVGAGGVF